MQWVYLSPHLDDVAFSCGGLVWEQSQAQHTVSVWTICAGDPPPGELSPFASFLHMIWQTGVEAAAQRRAEDLASCEVLGAAARHFAIPDCIYRLSPTGHTHLYASEEALFGNLHPDEAALVETLSQELEASLSPQTEVVAPLAIGNHVDHQLTRQAVEKLGRPIWYYPDYPYILDAASRLEELSRLGWEAVTHLVSEGGLQAWSLAIEKHASQMSTFWTSAVAMRQAIRRYAEKAGGVTLWRPPG